MNEDDKTISATKSHTELDPIECGLIAGGVLVVSAIIFAAILVSEAPGF